MMSDWLIPTLSNERVIFYQYCTDRDFALRLRAISQTLRVQHPGLILRKLIVADGCGHSHSIVAGGLPEIS
jgi:hypothetical protein